MITRLVNGSSSFIRFLIAIIKFGLVLWIGLDVIELYQTNPMYRSMSKFLLYAVSVWFLLSQFGFTSRLKRR